MNKKHKNREPAQFGGINTGWLGLRKKTELTGRGSNPHQAEQAHHNQCFFFFALSFMIAGQLIYETLEVYEP